MKFLVALLFSLAMTTTQLGSSPPLSEAPGSWKWPLPIVGANTTQSFITPVITEPFDPPEFKWSAGHRGIDLGGETGTTVTAPASGRVSFRGTVVDRPVLSIDHGDGYVSSFEPLESALKAGDAVTQGQVIGTIASGGHCTTRCVHWGVRYHDEYVDPMLFIVDTRPSVLLPWTEN